MPGKRSYVSAVPGCLTQDQLRRQARDRAFLPQPPPPPLLDVPRRRSAWADFPIGLEDDDHVVTTNERATQCDLPCRSENAEPPLSGLYLDTLNRALGTIEIQCQPAIAPAPPPPLECVDVWNDNELACLLESVVLSDSDVLDKDVSMPTTISLADLIPYFSCIAPESFYIGDDSESADSELRSAEADIEEKSIEAELKDAEEEARRGAQADTEEECNEAELKDTEEEARRGAQAMCAEADIKDAPGLFTAAQNSELNRIINASILVILDPFIDLVIGKCQTFVTTQVQNAFEPVCDDLRHQIKALQNESFYKQVPVHVRLKRYCFKRSDIGKFAHNQPSFCSAPAISMPSPCMECHFGCYYQTCPECGRKDGNSDSEKDDSDNLHDSDELNSMQASQFTSSLANVRDVLQDFDELSNPLGFISSPCLAASAFSLPGWSQSSP